MLYMAALAARRIDPGLKAFADRLAASGKPPKVVVVAVMRKLVEAKTSSSKGEHLVPYQQKPDPHGCPLLRTGGKQIAATKGNCVHEFGKLPG